MPKEMLHFTVALDAAARGNGSLARAARNKRSALLIGSIFHDILYYIPGNHPKAKALATGFHGGASSDSHELLRLQHDFIDKSPDRQTSLALLAGMVSHIQLDVSLHPLIWHQTGNYDADDPNERSRARQRHRALETLMDMTYAPPPGRQWSLFSLRRSTGLPVESLVPFTELARRADMSVSRLGLLFHRAFTTYGIIQHLTYMPFLPGMAYRLWRFLPSAIREITALLRSPQWLEQRPLLDNTISYRNPVTGDEFFHSVAELIEEGTQNTMHAWNALEAGTLPATGPNLDSGRPPHDKSSMRHFATPPGIRLPDDL